MKTTQYVRQEKARTPDTSGRVISGPEDFTDVSQPGMHGGASGLGYQLPSPVSAQQWVFGADGHLDWPHGAAVP